ncbi:hypothetical protein HY493_04095 [Candidatus Woesearchaeota archaeon]|nr:hypothetical protein [Candidatus Woesearchaeota archaeon]
MEIDLKFSQRWAEFWALFLIIIGFLFAVSVENVTGLYAVTILFGLVFGRLLFRFRKNLKGSILTIILGFMIGFLLGAQLGDRKVLILLFAVAMAVSFYVHETGWLRSAEY